MQILKSKKAESYVPVCVLILVIVMIFSGIFVYASAVSLIDTSRENSKVVLDSFVTQNATRIYDSIKQGNDYTESVNPQERPTQVPASALYTMCIPGMWI